MKIIGRKKELEELDNLYNSGKAELIAIYGRRRVGKTYLIDKAFEGKLSFRHAGVSPSEEEKPDSNIKYRNKLSEQLTQFYHSLRLYGSHVNHIPSDWMEAFYELERLLMERDSSRIVVFLDELPWMDTPKSNFIQAFESFWNNWACYRDNVMVIVSGSANAWMLNKLVNSHGGLYGRVTYEIKLTPFSLQECEELLLRNDVHLSRYDIAQCYMMLGGIPYYLNYFQKNLSLSQSIDFIFYQKNAKLNNEFSRLFSSTFKDASFIERIFRLLNKNSYGYTRQQIIKELQLQSGDRITRTLDSLIINDFILKYYPFGGNKREPHYKLIDPFCLFYLKFVDRKLSIDQDFWQLNVISQSIVSWRGLAFENLCFNHFAQIKKALGIGGVSSTLSLWSKKGDDGSKGPQIDMLIERKDNVVNMCEMKFYGSMFTIDKKYHEILLNRGNLLFQEISRKQIIHNVLITTYGLHKNEYSNDFSHVILLDDLFQ